MLKSVDAKTCSILNAGKRSSKENGLAAVLFTGSGIINIVVGLGWKRGAAVSAKPSNFGKEVVHMICEFVARLQMVIGTVSNPISPQVMVSLTFRPKPTTSLANQH